MPKRRHSANKEEKWRKKIRKYEEKLRRQHYGSDSEARPLPSVVEIPHRADSIEPEVCGGEPLPSPPAAAAASTVPELTEITNAPPSADPELLLALGDFEPESNEWGPEIYEDIAKRWEPILKEGLKKEVREELLKKCLFPKNCPLLKPPVLNPEISAMLTESARNRDTRVLKKQNQLACALTVLSKTMSDMLTKQIEAPAILKNLADAGKLIADSHYLETETRRSLVTPMVDKTFIEPFKNRKRDSHLFGEKLGDFIKSSRGIQKTGKLIQSSATSSDLNFKPSLPRTHSNYRGGRQSTRGRGAKFTPTQVYQRRSTAQAARGQRASTPPPSTSQRHKQSRPAKQKR
ncbi:uncharacterized protein [Maniola hyperantus]|uniref:uncharacterized protein n=1 Tax=Aphantopus hyperantus TaxID=2795564 RepID=UPI0037484EF7